MADLDNYDTSWWTVNVQPVLLDVAAGLIKDARWNRGPGHRIVTHYAPWMPAT